MKAVEGKPAARITAAGDHRIGEILVQQATPGDQGFSAGAAGRRDRDRRRLQPVVDGNGFGDTADFTRAAGGDADRFVALFGLRFWF